jgi:putative oxidoreductase
MNSLNRFADPFYSIMRLVIGLMFACHGLDKIFGTFAGKTEALPPLMMVGGWLEIICGFLIALGLLTRIAAFVGSGEMAVAFFMMHAPKGLIPYVNKGELAVVYCFIFFYIVLRGPGSWSIDAMIGRGRSSAQQKRFYHSNETHHCRVDDCWPGPIALGPGIQGFWKRTPEYFAPPR